MMAALNTVGVAAGILMLPPWNAHLRQLHFQTPQADIEIFTRPLNRQTTKLWAPKPPFSLTHNKYL